MSEQGIFDHIQQLVSEVNRGNLDAIRQHIAPVYFTNPPAEDEPSASETYYQVALGLKAAMPDLTVTMDTLAADGDYLTGQVTLAGTHSATLWGVPASGNRISVTTPVRIRPANDQVAINWDAQMPVVIGTLRQIGLVNPPDAMDKPSIHPVVMPEILMRLAFTGQAGGKPCTHLDDIQMTDPATDVCAECVALGDEWPALRMCLICGYVGCCDTSKNKHMDIHVKETSHPLIRSIEPGEGWIWCYPDNAFLSANSAQLDEPMPLVGK